MSWAISSFPLLESRAVTPACDSHILKTAGLGPQDRLRPVLHCPCGGSCREPAPICLTQQALALPAPHLGAPALHPSGPVPLLSSLESPAKAGGLVWPSWFIRLPLPKARARLPLLSLPPPRLQPLCCPAFLPVFLSCRLWGPRPHPSLGRWLQPHTPSPPLTPAASSGPAWDGWHRVSDMSPGFLPALPLWWRPDHPSGCGARIPVASVTQPVSKALCVTCQPDLWAPISNIRVSSCRFHCHLRVCMFPGKWPHIWFEFPDRSTRS